MDFPGDLSLRDCHEVSMVSEAERDHRSKKVSGAFALLTGKLEDAASLAGEGQGQQADDQLLGLARQIASLAVETASVASLLAVLLNCESKIEADRVLPD